MDKRLPAIPTLYKGIRFRSRLEARYAALFDALGWAYEYEPVELAGYIPDFLVTRGPTFDGPLLVECKPFVDASGLDAQDAASVGAKIRKAWSGSALIVSAAHHVESHGADSRIRIGRMWIDRKPKGPGPHPGIRAWADAYLWRVDSQWCITPVFAEWVGLLDSSDFLAARMAWADAGNVTQWKAPK